MKTIIILATAILSINALATTTIQTDDTSITNSLNENDSFQLKPLVMDNFLKKPAMHRPNILNVLNVAGPACAKSCESAFSACLSNGYPWNSCNWEFQDCADQCLSIPNC